MLIKVSNGGLLAISMACKVMPVVIGEEIKDI